MPKLLTFGACRQVIVNRDDGSISMINMMNSITVQRQPGQSISSDMNTPLDWGAAAIWLREDGDENETFEQRFLIISPNGQIINGGEFTFVFLSRQMSNAARIQGFPSGLPGIVLLKLEIREAGRDQEWKTSADYPIEVIHLEVIHQK